MAIIYLVSEYLKVGEPERKEHYLHKQFENILMGNPTLFSRYSIKLRVMEGESGISFPVGESILLFKELKA